MFLDGIENFSSQYFKGVKKISFRTSRPKILKDPIGLTFEKSHGNYDLFFNKNGLLIHSIHKEKLKNHKVTYGYNRKGVLVAAITLLSENNELLSISNFEYDNNGRIKREEVRSFYSSLGQVINSERIYTYSSSLITILMKSDDSEEDEHTIYERYNANKKLIEIKAIRNEDELMFWNKFEHDNEGNLLRELSLNDNGEIDGTYDYFRLEDKGISGYHFKSNNEEYRREYLLTLNEKGHWINQVVINDGDPLYFYDRTFEYY